MQVTRNSNLQIPESLRQKLLAFRRRVWCLKMFEAFAAALIGVLIGFLLVYGVDRFFDTPRILRAVIFAAAVLACRTRAGCRRTLDHSSPPHGPTRAAAFPNSSQCR